MFETPTVTHTQIYMFLEYCIHVHTQDPQTHMLTSKCLHMHEVHTSMFVYSCIPIYTFHTFAHSRKFAYLSLHTHNSHLYSYVYMLTYSPMFTHTLTMITYTHTCIYMHTYIEQITHSSTVVYTYAHLHVHLSSNTQTMLRYHTPQTWPVASVLLHVLWSYSACATCTTPVVYTRVQHGPGD